MSGFGHEKRVSDTVEWFTPPSVFEALKTTFDLDPASPGADVVPWIPATRHLTKADNGLVKPWNGGVWLNPPYDENMVQWATRFVKHGNGIWLSFARTDTQWFRVLESKRVVLVLKPGRIKFVPGIPTANNDRPGAPSVFAAMGEKYITAVLQSGLGSCWRML